MPLDPRDRPSLQFVALIQALAEHDVRWVLCGSQVLALHGGDITANDLDVVPDLDAENLVRVASCLHALDAIPAYMSGGGDVLETPDLCRAWRTHPPTAENLDHLYVTHLGMLDIVIKNADPYATLLVGAERMRAGDTEFVACHPERVLKSLEKRKRNKDRERQHVYKMMRERFGLPDHDW